MLRESPLQGLQETVSGSVSQASEIGGGLPEQALEKLDVAQASAQKLLKAITNLMSKMKENRGKNGLMDTAFNNLAGELVTLRAADSTLDGIKVLEFTPDKTTATCKKVSIVRNLADAKFALVLFVWPLTLAHTPYVSKRQ